MSELGPKLSQLGLTQYLDCFIEEGFDTWETVLDITESDLDALNVKLGHRRRLQRAIASARGIAVERPFTSVTRTPPIENSRNSGAEDKLSLNKGAGGSNGNGPGGKRKYRRHPKIDENAPERPPSAYVIFSNKVREELKPLNLSFTDIAKRVGESWQVLVAEEKEPYESQASGAKEKFRTELVKYKKTDEYKEHSQYLADFKAKNASNAEMTTPEEKRQRLDWGASTGNSPSAESLAEVLDSSPGTTVTGRGLDSISPMCVLPQTVEQSSLGSVPVSMARPFNFATHASNLGSASPGPLSPLTAIRRDSAAQGSPRTASLVQPSIEIASERNSELLPGHSLPRIVPLERRESRIVHGNSAGMMTDPKALRGRSSPQLSLRRSSRIPGSVTHQDSSVSSKSSSSVSSSISSGATTGTSIYTSASLLEEGRSQRSLPPLSTVGLVPILNSVYAESSGKSMHTPLGSQLNSAYTLPPLLNPPYISSPSTDFSQERRSLKGLSLTGIGLDPNTDHEVHWQEAQGEPRPQNRPLLPSHNRLVSEKDQKQNLINEDFPHEAFPSSHADPLSVLAFAGRIVDRGNR